MKKTKQPELGGMPERNQLGKVAARFADLDDEIAGLQADQKKLALELIPLFKEAGKKTIDLGGGRIVSMQTKSASTTIKCTAEKKRNTIKDTEEPEE